MPDSVNLYKTEDLLGFTKDEKLKEFLKYKIPPESLL